MTDEQRSLAEENCDLIYGFLRKYNLDIEEWYGTAAIAFCKACIAYDGRNNLSVIAYKYMYNAVCVEMKYAKYKKRDIRIKVQSLNEKVGKDEESIELIDLVPSKHKVDEQIIANDTYMEIMNLCKNDLQRKKIALMALYGSQGQVSKILNCSRQCVNNVVVDVRNRFRESEGNI